jgi:hypothetical protein
LHSLTLASEWPALAILIIAKRSKHIEGLSLFPKAQKFLHFPLALTKCHDCGRQSDENERAGIAHASLNAIL